LTTSTASGFSDDEPPAAALVLAGHCFKRLAPLYPAILGGQYLRSDSMTRALVASWGAAIHAAGVDEFDLAAAVRQISRGDLGGEPFSFPALISIARAHHRGRVQEAVPVPPEPQQPASEEKVRAACKAIRAGLVGMSARSAAVFGTETPEQH